jgi:hypothetical protein
MMVISRAIGKAKSKSITPKIKYIGILFMVKITNNVLHAIESAQRYKK